MEHPSCGIIAGELHEWLKVTQRNERQAEDTELSSFIKPAKRRSPFKKHFWALRKTPRPIGASLETDVHVFCSSIERRCTNGFVKKFIQAPEIHQPLSSGGAKSSKGE